MKIKGTHLLIGAYGALFALVAGVKIDRHHDKEHNESACATFIDDIKSYLPGDPEGALAYAEEINGGNENKPFSVSSYSDFDADAATFSISRVFNYRIINAKVDPSLSPIAGKIGVPYLGSEWCKGRFVFEKKTAPLGEFVIQPSSDF